MGCESVRGSITTTTTVKTTTITTKRKQNRKKMYIHTSYIYFVYISHDNKKKNAKKFLTLAADVRQKQHQQQQKTAPPPRRNSHQRPTQTEQNKQRGISQKHGRHENIKFKPPWWRAADHSRCSVRLQRGLESQKQGGQVPRYVTGLLEDAALALGPEGKAPSVRQEGAAGYCWIRPRD